MTLALGDLLGAVNTLVDSTIINQATTGLNAVTDANLDIAYTDASPTVPEFWPSGGQAISQASTGRKLLRLEVRNAETPIERKPEWIRTKLRTGPEYSQIRELVARMRAVLRRNAEIQLATDLFKAWSSGNADAPGAYLSEDAVLEDIVGGKFQGWPE